MTRIQIWIGVVGLLAIAILGYCFFIIQEDKALESGVVAFKKGDYSEAVKLLSPLAEKGNATAQLLLGIAYAHGHGVTKNKVRAQELLIASGKETAAENFFQVAQRFARGEQVAKDEQEALVWYQLAAERGHQQSQQILKQLAQSRTTPR
jgi:TPR repeat protein